MDQNLDLQRDALCQAGGEKLFEDIVSGAQAERPGLKEALEGVEKVPFLGRNGSWNVKPTPVI